MALRMSTDLKNYVVNQVVKQMAGVAGSAGTAEIKIYSGEQPANSDGTPGTGNVLLATIPGISWGTAGSNGTLGATAGTAPLFNTAGYSNTCATDGTAGWARMESFGTNWHGSAGTFRIDGDVGTSSTSTFIINTVVFSAGGTASILTASIYMS